MEISVHRTRAVFDHYNIVDEKDIMKAGSMLSEYHRKIMGTISGTVTNFETIQPETHLPLTH